MAELKNKPKALPTQEELRELLNYDADAGKFYWRSRPLNMFPSERSGKIWNSRYAGKEAFTALLKGYKQGRLLDKFVSAHRVAWKIFYGDEPNEIDHINGKRDDNRIVNLRGVDRIENMKNSAMWGHNTSGYTGVSWRANKQKWRAYIFADKKHRDLGLFDHLEDAVAARKAAEAKFGFHPNHGRA